MPLKNSRTFFINTCAALTLLVAGCTVTPATNTAPVDTAEMTTPKTVQLDFKKGQVLSFTVIDSKKSAEAKAARGEYYEKAFPLAGQFGLSRDMGFDVVAVPVGTFKPHAVVLFSWPSGRCRKTVPCPHPKLASYQTYAP